MLNLSTQDDYVYKKGDLVRVKLDYLLEGLGSGTGWTEAYYKSRSKWDNKILVVIAQDYLGNVRLEHPDIPGDWDGYTFIRRHIELVYSC